MGLMVAVPAARAALPRETVAPFEVSANVTVPVVVAAPAITLTVAVIATVKPAIPGFGSAAATVDVCV
jgi:hypothetical protein